jgi:hypothetical protein
MSEKDSDWLETEYEAIDDMESFRNQRGFTMRHPVLLVGVIAASIFLGVKTWERAAFFFVEATDCGVLLDRPALKAQSPSAAPELQHNAYCKLKGINEQISALSTAKEDGTQPFKDGNYESKAELEGVKYYVKLAGDNVIGVIPAHRDDVMRFRERKGSLTGFEFDEPGRLIDPSKVPSLRKTEAVLRIRWSIPDQEPIYIFDLSEKPSDRWKDLAVFLILAFTALLAFFGLIRLLLKGRSNSAA